MTPATLYVSITCDSVSDAQALLRRFIDAGLNVESSRVHTAIGDPVEARGLVMADVDDGVVQQVIRRVEGTPNE